MPRLLLFFQIVCSLYLFQTPQVPRKPKARQQERRPPPVAPDALLTLQAPAAGLLFPEFAYALKQQVCGESGEKKG